MSTSRGPGQRAGLDTARVVAAAADVLREDGVDALSLRSVARRLGVAPNTLYSHVRSKRDLLDLVLDDVLGEVRVPTTEELRDDPWRAVRQVMLACYDVLLTRPGLVPSYLDRQGAHGVHAQGLGRATVQGLREAGLDEAEAEEAMRVLIVTTIGFAAFSARTPPEAEGVVGAAALRRNYENGLDWLLGGMGAGLT